MGGISRRKFLKATAVGALALGAGPTIIIPRRVQAYQPGGRLHPNIDPLRVVGLQDPRMTTGENIVSNWQQQEALVAWDVVQQNLDAMASKLAQEADADDAWRAIFIKPAGKAWSDVTVAIKTNNIAEQHTRSAVMSKVCRVLTDVLGVKGSNIRIYDAKHGGSIARQSPFKGLPEGVRNVEKWAGIDTDTSVAAPYYDGERKSKCVGPLVRGDVDILVNIAMCKGHGNPFGRFTMCSKNHFGTFNPAPAHVKGGDPTGYLIGINKTPEILGAMDPATGDVLFPRQQLCIVDALWASLKGPRGLPSAQPNALFMGSCGPIVDSQVATRFRKGVMGWQVNPQVTGRMLSEFGFTEADLPNGGAIIDALA